MSGSVRCIGIDLPQGDRDEGSDGRFFARRGCLNGKSGFPAVIPLLTSLRPKGRRNAKIQPFSPISGNRRRRKRRCFSCIRRNHPPACGNINSRQHQRKQLRHYLSQRFDRGTASDTISAGETYLPNGATIFLSSGTFTASTSGAADELAPLNSNDTGDNTGSVVDAPALRVEWHEQGSVEGDLELVTDQLYGGNINNLPAGQAPLSLVTRAPPSPTRS